MGDLFFLIKTFVMTVFVVIALQVKVGDHTLETRAYNWIQESDLGGYLKETAQGLVHFASQFFKNVRGSMNDKFTELLDKENSPGTRTMKFHLERSKEYLEEQYKQARDHIKSNSNENNTNNNRNEISEPAGGN